MVCIYCQQSLSVNNSRPQKRSNQTWRRRPCKACGAVFTTIEAIDLSQAVSVLKNDSLTTFDRDRLFLSLYQSLRHRTTAISDARGLSDTVTAHIMFSTTNGQIAARAIFESALNTLQRFDKAAATHYAAFHSRNQ